MVSRWRIPHSWRGHLDPESEVLVLTIASTALAGLGLALILMGALPAAPAAAPVTTGRPVAAPGPTGEHRSDKLGRSLPLSLDIPTIGVHTRLMTLGLNRDGTVEVPPVTRTAPAGWYKNLSTPGEAGPAVILGHVDAERGGPAVFYRLKELKKGDDLSIDRADGRTAYFTVRSVARYPRTDFPTDAVYGSRPDAELRLVTCGGSFDPIQRHYRDNVVVYATMTGSTPTSTPGSLVG